MQVVGGGAVRKALSTAHENMLEIELFAVFHITSLSLTGVAYSGIGLQIAGCFFVYFVHYTILFSFLKTCNAWPCHLQIVLRSLPIFSAVFSIVRQFMYKLVSTLM